MDVHFSYRFVEFTTVRLVDVELQRSRRDSITNFIAAIYVANARRTNTSVFSFRRVGFSIISS